MSKRQKTIDDKIDDLALMVKRGFDDIEERMVTKEDLKHFATKEDLKQLATRKDLDTLEKKMETEFTHVNGRLDYIADGVSDLPAIREELYALDRRVTRLEHARKT